MNSLKNKIQNLNTNFSKNVVANVVVPLAIVILSIALAIFVGFNKGIDFNGGILVSVKTEQNLEDSKEYATFKNKVSDILNDNKVAGSVFLVEKDSATYNSVLVVKINYNTNNEKTSELVNSLKSDLVAKFYSSETEEQIDLRHLVDVSTFGESVPNSQIISTILATLVSVLVICLYIGFRQGIHSAVLTILSSFISCVLAMSLFIISRVQINEPALAFIPLTALLSAIATYLFIAKTNKLLKTGNYERKSNYDLTNDAVKENLYCSLKIFGFATLFSLVFALINATNSVVFLGLGIIALLIAVAYTNLFIIPFIFALSFVRKVKKEKAKQEKQEAKLDETEVLTETDLNNLTSN